ncbi:hypothetical protein [Fulvimarina sp. MAC8]|uniref:hypothetical protein n=1 Tax=Fulvimarina sp. MAC8 TaxID=3162874 RepID=UPI0032EF1BED
MKQLLLWISGNVTQAIAGFTAIAVFLSFSFIVGYYGVFSRNVISLLSVNEMFYALAYSASVVFPGIVAGFIINNWKTPFAFLEEAQNLNTEKELINKTQLSRLEGVIYRILKSILSRFGFFLISSICFIFHSLVYDLLSAIIVFFILYFFLGFYVFFGIITGGIQSVVAIASLFLAGFLMSSSYGKYVFFSDLNSAKNGIVCVMFKKENKVVSGGLINMTSNFSLVYRAGKTELVFKSNIRGASKAIETEFLGGLLEQGGVASTCHATEKTTKKGTK